MSDLPDPLVPADCDLRDFAFMPMDIVRLFGSRFHAIANDGEWRAGVTLWLKSFHQVPAASLPDDEIELCRLAELGRDLKAWRKLRTNALHGCLKCSDGRLYHPIVAEKANEAWDKKQIQRRRSAAGNSARWGKRDHLRDEPAVRQGTREEQGDRPFDVPEGHEQGNQKGSLKESQKESLKDRKGQGQGEGKRDTPLAPLPGGSPELPLSTGKTTRAPRAKARSPIPQGFRPSNQAMDWLRGEARKRGISLKRSEVEDQTEAMVDHHAGKGNIWADHDAVWRRWMRNYLSWPSGPSTARPASNEAFRV